MINLPLWVLPDKFPSIYDSESFTAIEMVSKLYGAMKTFTDEYNKFAEETNKQINDFMESAEKDWDAFAVGLRQEFQDFIDTVELKLMGQDKQIDDAIKFMKNNLNNAVRDLLVEIRENGELTEDVLTAFDDLGNRVDENAKRTTINSNLYPSLTEEQKSQIKELADLYVTNRLAFEYYGAVTRNIYAEENKYMAYMDTGKWMVNCELFVQLVWMGRSVGDFVDKTEDTYSPTITKAFDWGYYFAFSGRPLYSGLAKRDADGNPTYYYGFKNPNPLPTDENGNIIYDEVTYKDSLSYNTRYDENAESLQKQVFNSYMCAGDMAYELDRMGCGVPLSEIEVGDLVFSTTGNYETLNSHNKAMYKNISHVSIVTEINETGIVLVESTNINGDDKHILRRREFSSYESDKLRTDFLLRNAVLVARHPVAFGYEPNVPDEITVLQPAYAY